MFKPFGTNITANLLTVKMNSLNVLIGFVDSFLQRRRYGRYTENPAAVCDIAAVFLGCAGMEYHGIFVQRIQSFDDIAFMG